MRPASPIASVFADLKRVRRMAFMPFVTAGDPDLATTLALIRELARCRVDLIEVGFPYSDPIADGPVIQASYTRALARGLRIPDIFAAIAQLRNERVPPLVAMVSYALVFRTGAETFAARAQQAGFSGLIVPDLPGDEAQELAAVAAAHGLDLAQLVSPTTTPARAERILQAASGFVYCISIAGTTGERPQLPPALAEQLRWLRTKTELPLAVGFGISRPEQVAALRGLADGVIVGSAIVRRMEALSAGSAPAEQVISEIGRYASEMLQATTLETG